MANTLTLEQMALKIGESSLSYEEFMDQVSGKTRQTLCSLINEVYCASNLEEGVSQVVVFLELVLEEDLDLAAFGADALYNRMEANGHLEHPNVFHLHIFAQKLVHKLQHDPNSRSTSGTEFRVFGLTEATQVLVESIHCNWIRVLRSGGNFKDITDAAKTFPEHVDISRVLCQGYSKTISDALKAVDFVESLRPNFRLVMRGFGKLLERICDTEDEINEVDGEDPVDTDEFMELVHRFKNASQEGRYKAGDSEFEDAQEAIPSKIRTLFFPPSGYCVLYNPSLNRYAANNLNAFYNDVTYMMSEFSTNCKYKLTSSMRLHPKTVVFEIVDEPGSGGLFDRQKFESQQIGEAAACILTGGIGYIVGSSIAIADAVKSVDRVEQSLQFRYKLKPCNRGNLFTITNVTAGGILVAVMDTYTGCLRFRSDLSEDTRAPEALWKILDYGERC